MKYNEEVAKWLRISKTLIEQEDEEYENEDEELEDDSIENEKQKKDDEYFNDDDDEQEEYEDEEYENEEEEIKNKGGDIEAYRIYKQIRKLIKKPAIEMTDKKTVDNILFKIAKISHEYYDINDDDDDDNIIKKSSNTYEQPIDHELAQGMEKTIGNSGPSGGQI